MKFKEILEGWSTLPKIDRERYTDIPGLEGPFIAKNGRVYYYDPQEGKYYDRDTDMYLSDEEAREMDEGIQEAHTPGNVDEARTPHARASDPKPKTNKPPKKGNTSPHPMRNKMVGEAANRAWKTRAGKWANRFKGGFDSEEAALAHVNKETSRMKKNKVTTKDLEPRPVEEKKKARPAKKGPGPGEKPVPKNAGIGSSDDYDRLKSKMKKDWRNPKAVDESPMVLAGNAALHKMVATLFSDFIESDPSKEQLAQILKVMGKSLDVKGQRSVIDQLKGAMSEDKCEHEYDPHDPKRCIKCNKPYQKESPGDVNEMFYGDGATGVKFFHVDKKVHKSLQGTFPQAKISHNPKRQTATVTFPNGVDDEIDKKVDWFNSNWVTRSMYLYNND